MFLKPTDDKSGVVTSLKSWYCQDFNLKSRLFLDSGWLPLQPNHSNWCHILNDPSLHAGTFTGVSLWNFSHEHDISRLIAVYTSAKSNKFPSHGVLGSIPVVKSKAPCISTVRRQGPHLTWQWIEGTTIVSYLYSSHKVEQKQYNGQI